MRTRFLVASLAIFSSFSHAGILVSDGFESASMSTPNSPSPAVNTTGFAWGSNNRTAVVTMLNGAPTKVWENGAIQTLDADTTKNWTAKNGSYSLRFRHPAGLQMAEQQFTIGTSVPDLWMSYWIRVPVNFYHGTLNNKWLATWTSVYDGTGDITFQTRPYSSTPGGASLVVQDGGVAQGEATVLADFILVPRDLGRWMQIVYRLKPATTSSSNDGIIQTWRRWANESSFTQILNKTNARFYQGGTGIKAGYIMGWENDPYKVETEFLMDDFTLSTTSLLDVSSTSSTSSPPAAPSLNVTKP